MNCLLNFCSDHSPVYATFNVGTELRFISALTPTVPQKRIVFKKLYVSGRSGSLVNKPILAFYGSFLYDSPLTSKKMKIPALVNPQFDDESLPAIEPMTNNVEFLCRQHIIISVQDLGHGKDASENTIGYCSLALCHAMGPEPFKFSVDLSWKTQGAGKLNGYFHVITAAPISK